MSLLTLRGLGFRRDGRWLLRGVDASLEAGELLGVVGESGAGKSTLAWLALGLLVPTEGEILLEGGPWPTAAQRTRVQGVFQEAPASLPPHLTGWQILEQPLAVHRALSGPARRDAAAQAAARVCLPEACLDLLPSLLSGGMGQRLCLARALILEPAVLVLDEPLSGLDPTLAAQLVGVFRELGRQGTAILLVCHDLTLVRRLCHRVLALREGRPLWTGPAAELEREPRMAALWAATSALP